jgi:hypothetical protein
MSSGISRRDFSLLTGTLAAAVLAAPAESQPSGGPFPPEDAGKRHREALERAMAVLAERIRARERGNALLTEDGFNGLIDQLVKQEQLNPDDARLLRSLVKALLEANSAEEMQKIADGHHNPKAGGLARAVVSIVKDSARWVSDKLKGVSIEKVRLVVLHDVGGALEGAAAGAEIGSAFAGIGAGPGALFGLVIGSSATSLIAIYDDKK